MILEYVLRFLNEDKGMGGPNSEYALLQIKFVITRIHCSDTCLFSTGSDSSDVAFLIVFRFLLPLGTVECAINGPDSSLPRQSSKHGME